MTDYDTDVVLPNQYTVLPAYQLLRQNGVEPPADVRAAAIALHRGLDEYMGEHYPAVRSITTHGGVTVWARHTPPPPRSLYVYAWIATIATMVGVVDWVASWPPAGLGIAVTVWLAGCALVFWGSIRRKRRDHLFALRYRTIT